VRYRRLGRTELRVSELGFGAARGAKETPEEFGAAVGAALEGGINFVDTAAGYDGGESERLLGRLLADRPEVIIETKYCPYENYKPGAKYTGSPRALMESVEESLRRLRRDRLDVLLAHGLRTLETFERFMSDGCYDALLKAREQGKARFIGMSELSEADGTHEVLKRAVPTGAFDVVMLTLNFMLQTAGEVLPQCAARDVGAVVMMPLNHARGGSGLTSLPAARECARRHIAAGNLPDAPPYTGPDLFDFLLPYSIPQAALRYVLAHEIGCCCVGVRAAEHLKENLRAVDPPYLDEARMRRLRELFGGIRVQVF
jgi:aryl-alcohol dehydrogenase-like predicted oxidoreductase